MSAYIYLTDVEKANKVLADYIDPEINYRVMSSSKQVKADTASYQEQASITY